MGMFKYVKEQIELQILFRKYPGSKRWYLNQVSAMEIEKEWNFFKKTNV